MNQDTSPKGQQTGPFKKLSFYRDPKTPCDGEEANLGDLGGVSRFKETLGGAVGRALDIPSSSFKNWGGNTKKVVVLCRFWGVVQREFFC